MACFVTLKSSDTRLELARNTRQCFDMAQVTCLCRYPLKGFTAEEMATVELEAGEGFPFDRIYAVENGRSRFDPAAPRWLPKVSFLMLMRHERLATLKTVFDETGHTLTILRGERQLARGQLTTKLGRQMIEQFLAAYLQTELKGPPRILSAEGHRFTDIAAKAVHLVNLETVRDLGRQMGTHLNPLRFRANLYFDGVAAWEENAWVGRTIAIGEVRLKVFDRTARCAATDVNPETAERGASIPSALEWLYGHNDLGLYARVVSGGRLTRGDALTLEP
jgi:hypothetical protein